MKNSLQNIFTSPKPIISMLHLGYLLGTPQFTSVDELIKKAEYDIKACQENGIDGLLIENWKEDSIGEFVSPETAISLAMIVRELAKSIKIPFGINVLNNDYKTALSIAKLAGAKFVQQDVYVDHVVSDFKYSPLGAANPFEIHPSPQKIQEYAKSIGAQNIPLFVFVQPKHYKMLDPSKTIEQSATEAASLGASALLVTKETGSAPTLDLIKRAKSASNNIPVGIGSGFSEANAAEFIPVVDFAVVGTSIKVDNVTDNPVDPAKVKSLMSTVKALVSCFPR